MHKEIAYIIYSMNMWAFQILSETFRTKLVKNKIVTLPNLFSLTQAVKYFQGWGGWAASNCHILGPINLKFHICKISYKLIKPVCTNGQSEEVLRSVCSSPLGVIALGSKTIYICIELIRVAPWGRGYGSIHSHRARSDLLQFCCVLKKFRLPCV